MAIHRRGLMDDAGGDGATGVRVGCQEDVGGSGDRSSRQGRDWSEVTMINQFNVIGVSRLHVLVTLTGCVS